jgi:hypothetical protein
MTVKITGQLVSPSPSVLPGITFASVVPIVDPAADTVLLPFVRPAVVLSDGSFELDLLPGQYVVRITVGAKVLRGLLIVPDDETTELDIADALQFDVVPDPGGGDPGDPGDVTWASIVGKPSTFPPSTHSHPISGVTGLQAALDGKSATGHVHSIANVTGLQAALDAKADDSELAAMQADIDGKATTSALTDLGEAVAGDTEALDTAITAVAARVTVIEGMTPVVLLWDGSAYVEAPLARVYVGGPGDGGAPDGSLWVPEA